LQIGDIRADAILTPIASDLIWRSSLVVYYWCWILGAYFDTNVQELAYASFPGKGKWPLQGLAALVLLVLVAGAMLKAEGNIKYFSLALAAFVAVDHLLWFYLKYVLRQSAARSETEYLKKRQYYDLEILRTVNNQVQGAWKYRRLAAGAAIVLIMNLFAFNQWFRDLVAGLIRAIAPWLSMPEATNLAYTILVLLFVVVMEVSHWFMRFSMAMKLRALNSLAAAYKLTRRRDVH
jgi:hypothetical protein